MVEKLQNALLHPSSSRSRGRRKQRGRARVLDVGCGRGVLLQEFRRRGWDVLGTELSEQAASYARQSLKFRLKLAISRRIHFRRIILTRITLWHVLEHVPNPRALLAEIYRNTQTGRRFAGRRS